MTLNLTLVWGRKVPEMVKVLRVLALPSHWHGSSPSILALQTDTTTNPILQMWKLRLHAYRSRAKFSTMILPTVPYSRPPSGPYTQWEMLNGRGRGWGVTLSKSHPLSKPLFPQVCETGVTQGTYLGWVHFRASMR